jgi:opacity protein-like surface antigen
MRKAIALAVIAIVMITAFAADGYADKRSYVWTYEYMTMLKGRFELEYYLTQEQKNINKAKPNTWKNWFELEYGITDHWDISMYQMFKQSNTAKSDKFEYEGFKIRTRYRILGKNKLPVDVLLYLEYIMNPNATNQNTLEGKVILAKDIGRFNIAYNQIVKQELAADVKTKHEYAAGLSYAVTPQFKVGCETKGNYTEDKYYIGPTISYAWPMKAFVTLGAVAGLTEKSDDLQTRLIVGFLF